MTATPKVNISRKNRLRESEIQATLIHWSEYINLPGMTCRVREYLFAIPNGGSRNLIEAKNLKSQGVTAGVSDLFLAFPSNGFHGLFLELKTPEGIVSGPQQRFIEKMRATGYCAEVAFGIDEAIQKVLIYLQEPHVLHTHKRNEEKPENHKKTKSSAKDKSK